MMEEFWTAGCNESMSDGEGCREDIYDKSDQFDDDGEKVKELELSDVEGESEGDFVPTFGLVPP